MPAPPQPYLPWKVTSMEAYFSGRYVDGRRLVNAREGST
jgi:hypothetical protein